MSASSYEQTTRNFRSTSYFKRTSQSNFPLNLQQADEKQRENAKKHHFQKSSKRQKLQIIEHVSGTYYHSYVTTNFNSILTDLNLKLDFRFEEYKMS